MVGDEPPNRSLSLSPSQSCETQALDLCSNNKIVMTSMFQTRQPRQSLPSTRFHSATLLSLLLDGFTTGPAAATSNRVLPSCPSSSPSCPAWHRQLTPQSQKTNRFSQGRTTSSFPLRPKGIGDSGDCEPRDGARRQRHAKQTKVSMDHLDQAS